MTDRIPNPATDRRTTTEIKGSALPESPMRLRGRVRLPAAKTAAVALTTLLLGAGPAYALIGAGIEQFHEQQVERFLLTVVDEQGGDRAWTWETMIHSCTTTLMRGSPEQDPEQSLVRFTPDARRFLQSCAFVKGFQPRATPRVEPPLGGPVTPTLQRRIGILGMVLVEWMGEASDQRITVARRNEECARWIDGRPEWNAMLAKSGGLTVGGMTAGVTAQLIACGRMRGFEVRPEKMGEPLKALNEAAKAEAEAAKNQ
jgi:hypothetical protein